MKTSPFTLRTGFLMKAAAASALLCLMPVTLHGDPLSYAARCADSVATERALKAGGNPNQLDAAGSSTLYHAVITRNPRLVEMLLTVGAKPHVDAQSKEPLWAACVNGDMEIIAALLKAGADPEAGVAPLRAVDAAILSGRVEVLRKLTDAKPEMALPFKFPVNADSFSEIRDLVQVGVRNTVDDAIVQQHFKMAEFLIQNGALKGSQQTDINDLLLRAVSLTPVRIELIEALVKSGANPMVRADTPWMLRDEYLPPISPLEAVARLGRADMVKRLATGTPGQIAANRLLTLALHSEDRATVDVVRSFAPNAREIPPDRRLTGSKFLLGPEAEPRHSWDTKASADILLLPRTKAPPSVATPPDAKTRVAVIADANSRGEGDLLAARLSMTDGIEVIDREELAAIMRERNFTFESKSGITDIADRLNASELLLVSKPGTKAEGVLRAEVVDVLTGLVTHRMHTAAADFNPEPWIGIVTSAIQQSKERIKSSADGLNAITLLGVGAIDGMQGGAAIRSLVSAALMAEVDATPGCISLTRLQMKPVLEEQTLGGKGTLWKTGWAIEAGAAALDDDRIELRFRLRNLRTSESFETAIKGVVGQIAELVAKSWSDLSAKSQIGKASERRVGSMSNEAKVLLEEANWRFRLREYEAAAQLADAVCAMRGSDPETQFLRISARVRSLVPPFDDERSENWTWVRGTVLYDIQGWLETLALMNAHFDETFDAAVRRHQILRGKGGSRPDGGPDEWLQTLIRQRAATPAWAVRPDDKAALAEFDREFESWTRRLFKKCAAVTEKGELIMLPIQLTMQLDTAGIHHVPWLADATAGLLAVRFRQSAGIDWAHARATNDIYQALVHLAQQPHKPLDASSLVLDRLDGLDDIRTKAFKQDATFISASDSGRAEIAKGIAIRHLAAIRSGKPETACLLPISELARYHLIERREFNVLPETPSDLLVPVPPGGISNGELLRNLGIYAAMRAPNSGPLAERLIQSAMPVAAKEAIPGAARLRARISSVMQFTRLDDPRLKNFLEKLPSDQSSKSDAAKDTQGFVSKGMYAAVLKEGPAGAEFFIVSHVLPDTGRGLVWWSGCFVRGKVMGDGSQPEVIPGLVRVNCTTGETAVTTPSNRWLAWEMKDKMINPEAMSVHTNGDTVVWYVARNGVWQVDPATMELDLLTDKIQYVPNSMQQSGRPASALVGDAFFVAEEIREDNRSRQRILRLRKGDPPFVVVETGRRPMVTELDTDGTQLTMVAGHDDKCRIIANSEPAYLKRGIKMVSFDAMGKPIDGSQVNDRNPIQSAVIQAWGEKLSVTSGRKSWVTKSGGQLRSGSKPGMLEMLGNGNNTQLPVKLPLPEGFAATFHASQLDGNGRMSRERADMSAMTFATNQCLPVIVHQNGEKLGIMISWNRGKYLFPIIWWVQESELLPATLE